MKEILKNAFRCKKCGEVVESKHRHDFATCKCGNFTDGGHDYIRMGGALEDMEDLCEYSKEEENDGGKEWLKFGNQDTVTARC